MKILNLEGEKIEIKKLSQGRFRLVVNEQELKALWTISNQSACPNILKLLFTEKLTHNQFARTLNDDFWKKIDDVLYINQKGGKMAKYEIYKDKSGLWRWRIKARNGRIIAQGEGYLHKGNAFRGLKCVLDTVGDDACLLESEEVLFLD